MTEKGCDNCYYTYFDERAYPCALCIRGIERTDQWQPSKKTKAEVQTEEWHDNCNTCRWHDGACTIPCCDYEPKTEPQRGCDADCNEDCNECAKEWQDWKDQMWAEAVIEPQTDCSWKKGE